MRRIHRIPTAFLFRSIGWQVFANSSMYRGLLRDASLAMNR
jgi:hypothetical protein